MSMLQKDIITALCVKPTIHVKQEIDNRIQFIKDYLKKSGLKGYVLGISGGQDSTLAGKLIQRAMEELNQQEKTDEYQFFAIRLPYGVQADEKDAQAALAFIQPYRTLSINVKPAVDASNEQFTKATGEKVSDFVKGNTKARERMKVQFDLAAHYRCLVAGTDHSAEAVTGFYTKFGDGACDIAPLFGLNKRQGKELLKHLDGPAYLHEKVPTADLEDNQPQLSDEEALGMTYDQIDDYLEGKLIRSDVQENLERRYMMTEHKRQLPITIFDDWWRE